MAAIFLQSPWWASLVAAAFVYMAAAMVGPTAHAGPFDSIAGRWQGQAEYYANTAAGPIDAAHAVVPLVIEIDAGGKITGESPENGCRLLGLVTAGSSTTSFRLQVTLTNCRSELMNRRYQGQLAHHTKNGTLGFGLSASSRQPATQYSVSSTMMR